MGKNEVVLSYLAANYPGATCTLTFKDPFQCLIAVSLSAQTTDKAVNEVTPALFSRYPDPFALAQATPQEVEKYIKRLGLYHNKAKHLVDLSNALVNQFENAVPLDKESLMSLPGVGIKTANVVLANCAAVPSIPVDTHVGRIAKCLGYARTDDEPEAVEKKLEKQFPKEEWLNLHYRLIAFGRDVCHSKNPECGRCGLTSVCPYFKKYFSTIGK